jgi:hypothetical protein
MKNGKNNGNECESIQNLFSDYLRADLDVELEDEVENHVKQCKLCKDKLEIEKNKLFGFQESENKRKIHKKIGFVFNRKIVFICIGTLLILALLQSIVMPISLSLLFGYRIQPANQAVIDKLQFTVPCSDLEDINTHIGLTRMDVNVKYKITKLGEDNLNEDMKVSIPNIGGKPIWEEIYDNDRFYSYKTVDDKMENIKNVWSKLELNKTGTLAQIALNFKNPVSTSEMEDLLSKVGAKIDSSWFAVNLEGMETEYVWGFPTDVRKPILNHNNITYSSSRGKHIILDASEDFKSEMNEFEKNSKYLSKDISDEVGRVNKYITNNGVKINGFVTVIPTSKYEVLKNYSNIASIKIIKVDFDY